MEMQPGNQIDTLEQRHTPHLQAYLLEGSCRPEPLMNKWKLLMNLASCQSGLKVSVLPENLNVTNRAQ